MNQNAPQPSFELPSLPSESLPAAGSPQERPASSPEQNLQPIASGQPMASPQALASAPPVPSAPLPQPLQSQAPAVASPQVADDNDLIEKEWVIKAKQIVAATKEDPYTQNREMSKFKADYLKKRYNKDIKVEGS